MKNQVVINKKIIVPPTQKKTLLVHNPYNDLPSSQIMSPTAKSPPIKIQTLTKPAQKQKIDKKIQMSKSPASKPYKLVSPDVARTVGLSANSNDSVNKVKVGLVESKKLIAKPVKVQKYNDYFEMEGPGKKQVNASKKSTDSNNSSVKSVQSQSKKFVFPHKDLNKGNTKIPTTKPFQLTPSATKQVQINPNDSNKIEPPGLSNILNNIPIAKPSKPGDDRKSWSYSNLNTHTKTNSKQLDLNKSPFFANVDLKNTRNTAGHVGNPEVIKKSPGIQAKNGSNQKTGKSISKREVGKFVPSASKSQNSQSSDKFKKLNDSNKLSSNCEKKIGGFIPSKQQTFYTYPKILQIGQSLTLRVISSQSHTKIATFKVLRILAQDEKTSLYLVEQKYSHFIYCLKKCEIVKPNKNNTDEHLLNTIQYLIRQSKIGASINHPNIIKTYSTLYDSMHIYHLLQFIEGSNLYDRNKDQFCKTKSISQRDGLGVQKSSLSTFVNKMYSIKQIIYQLLQALAYLHHRGIVHRDIKPANILITHDNSYKVGDFGTAIWEFSGEPIGTLDYAAPQVMTKDKYDYSVDIWAVGCIAFELYVGYPPFFNQNRDVTIKKIIDCSYEHILLQDEGLASLVSKMLQKRPQKRISAKQALLHPFLSEFKHIKEQL